MRRKNSIIIADMQYSHGYSLIELIITIAIIVILATVPYPVYTHHIMKTHRQHAEVVLLSLAQQMENYAQLHGNYRKATLASLKIATSTEPDYTFSVKIRGSQHYLLEAQPIKSQTNDDCGILQLNEIGEQKALGHEPVSCW